MKRLALLGLIALELAAPLTRAQTLNVQLTPFGSPTWQVVDVHLFTAPIGLPTNFSDFSTSFQTLFPFGQHDPPYTNALTLGLANAHFRESTNFFASEFSYPNAVWLAWVVVPGTNAPTGSSFDFASGPIIPNSILPINLTGHVNRNGVLFDPNWSDTAPQAFGVDGHSHFPEVNAEAAGFGDGSPAPGHYHMEFTETDAGANGWIIAADFTVPERIHDIAVLKIKAPKVVTLKLGASVTKRVTIQIQNRSAHAETIPTLEALSNLVSVVIGLTSIVQINDCTAPPASFITGPPNIAPRTLAPGQKLNVFYNVTFNCAVFPGKGLGFTDFYYDVHAQHTALDADVPDDEPYNDACPRVFDDAIGDKGCGSKFPKGSSAAGKLGNAVLTDVVIK